MNVNYKNKNENMEYKVGMEIINTYRTELNKIRKELHYSEIKLPMIERKN